MLPDGDIWGHAVLAVVEKDNPSIGVRTDMVDSVLVSTYIPSGSIDSPMKNS